MALKKCKECGNQVSTRADKCPNCGAPVKKKRQQIKVGCLGTIIVLVLVGVIVSKVSNYFEERQREKDSQRYEQAQQERKEKIRRSLIR